MADFKERIAPDWAEVLDDVLKRAGRAGGDGVVAFDLDSTLFDNRPRQARIVREYGLLRGIAPLVQCQASHFDSGWDMRGALKRCGVWAEEVERIYPELKLFWEERFFTSPYCLDDVAVAGSAAYVTSLARTGVLVCYVTGRHEGMRAGTEESMRRERLPVPSGNVSMMMKPNLAVDDDDFKRGAHDELQKLGKVIAAFDNEPIHVNDYRRKFPEAVVVHLATDHSGRAAEISQGVLSIPHFARPK